MDEEKDNLNIEATSTEAADTDFAPVRQEQGGDEANADAPESNADESPDATVEDAVGELRSRLEETLHERYGEEADYSDDEQFYQGVIDLLEERGVRIEEADQALTSWSDFDSRLRGALEKDPRAGQFIANVLDGMDVIDNLMDILGPELVDAVNSPDARKKIDELKAKAQAVEDEREANAEASQAVIDAFTLEKGEADTQAFGEWINKMLDEFQKGIITRESLDALWKGYRYDDDVAESEIRGRNANIVAQQKDREKGDGVPSLADLGRRAAKPDRKNAAKPRNFWEGQGKLY